MWLWAPCSSGPIAAQRHRMQVVFQLPRCVFGILGAFTTLRERNHNVGGAGNKERFTSQLGAQGLKHCNARGGPTTEINPCHIAARLCCSSSLLLSNPTRQSSAEENYNAQTDSPSPGHVSPPPPAFYIHRIAIYLLSSPPSNLLARTLFPCLLRTVLGRRSFSPAYLNPL